MIVQETYEVNGHLFVRTWSDEGRYVVGGNPAGQYTEANDPVDAQRTYVEGGPMEGESNAEEILNILLGGDGE